jgi:prevent-host-death family protein
MPSRATTGLRTTPRRRQERANPPAWKLEDAKARFSEVVRRARTEGPQRVTVRGKGAVVVIAADALEKLLPATKPRQSLVAFLKGIGLGEIDLVRERDAGRDISL